MKLFSIAFFLISYFVFTRIFCDVRSKYVREENLGKNNSLVSHFWKISVNITKDAVRECLKSSETCMQDAKTEQLSKYFFSAMPPLDITSTSTDKKCVKDNLLYLEDLKQFKLWALKMYDSNSKLPSGILNGNINQFGDFDLCLSAHEEGKDVRGKYCLAELQVEIPHSSYLSLLHKLIHAHYAFKSNLQDPGHRVPRFSSIHWAVCVPASCPPEDVKRGLGNSLRTALTGTGLNFRLDVERTMCQTRNSYVPSKVTIIVASFFAGISGLATLATIYDYNTLSGKNDYIVAFSLKKNLPILVSTERCNNDIKAVHGIRFLNAFMLIIAHKCMAIFFTPYVNRTQMSELIGQPWAVIGRAASLYTDPFIMLSGMLTTYSILGRLQRKNKINVLEEYISRLFRIIPTLAALILFCTHILPHLNSGPLWNLVVTHHADICKKNWWRNFLFVHNYFGFEEMCLTHTHHVGIDTQLFFVSPLFILLVWKWPKKGTFALITMALISTFMRYYVTHVRNLSNYVHYGTSIQQLFNTADHMYILPFHRLTVYIMGILLAFLLKHHKTPRLSKFQLQIGNHLAFLSFVGSFFGPSFMGNMDYVYNPTHAACYAAFAPILWCFSFGWIIFTSHTGHEGNLSRFLSWRGFLIWTKLSYTVYLTQFPVFFYNVGTTRNAGYYSVIPTTVNLSEYVCILLSSLFLTLLFEMPFQNIKNILFKTKKTAILKNDFQRVMKVS